MRFKSWAIMVGYFLYSALKFGRYSIYYYMVTSLSFFLSNHTGSGSLGSPL